VPTPIPFLRLRAGSLRGPGPTPLLAPRAAQSLATFRMIDAIDEAPPADRLAWQGQALTRTLLHARQHSPFWAARIPEGKLRLTELPILLREEARRQVAAEGALPLPEAHGEAVPGATSGSTGQALSFFVSAQNALLNTALYAAQLLRHGIDLDQPMTALRYGIAEKRSAGWSSLVGALFRTGPMRAIGAETMTVAQAAAWLEAEAPIGQLVVLPHVLSGLLDLVEEGRAKLPGVADILPWAEVVDAPLRARARRLLGPHVRLLDRYSCEEIGPLSFQCTVHEDHQHVAHANALLEVVDDAGRPLPHGTPGRVLATGLHALATPFIRYELGDIATLLPRCPCGHAGPTLVKLLGRSRSLLRLPNGERRWLRLVGADWHEVAPGVREWRILQVGPAALVLEVVAEAPLTPAEHAALRELLARRVDPAFAVEIREQDRIDWGTSYKRADVVHLAPG
jgi:phenylacetate-CoA ligase